MHLRHSVQIQSTATCDALQWHSRTDEAFPAVGVHPVDALPAGRADDDKPAAGRRHPVRPGSKST
eukprot:9704044-Lingulodinium_polyedra.AAC.1